MNTSQTIDWQKRADKAEDELGDWRVTFPGRNASEAVQLLADAHAELEGVQKQAEAMKEAIKYCIADWKERHVGLLKKALEPTQDFPTPDELRAKAETYGFAAADLEHALKSTPKD